MVSRTSTCPCCLWHCVTAGAHDRVALVSDICRSQDCQIMSEHTCQSHVNWSRDCQRPCQSHTCQSHKCPSNSIRAGIFRDYDKAHFHSWDYLRPWQSHTCHSARIVRDYVGAHFHSWNYQRLCQTNSWQSHMNQTGIVGPYQSHTCHTKVAMNPR